MSSFEEIPEEFLCPITYELMDDPVVCEDGYTYNRSSVNKLRNNRSPFTREIINISRAVSNRVLKNIIEKYKTDNIINKKWKNNLQSIKEYIDINNKIPSTTDKNKQIKILGRWLSSQKAKYNEDIKQSKRIMKDKEIHKIWSDFINDKKYKKYIVINLNKNWKNNLQSVKEYIDINNKIPSQTNKNKEIKTLECWLSTQEAFNEDIKQSKRIIKDYSIAYGVIFILFYYYFYL